MRTFISGRLPLAPSFWKYTILYGTIANLVATLASLSAHVAGLPDMLGLTLYLLPLPYSVIAILGVWRSAATYTGPAHWATWARFGVVLWGGVMIFV